ncbi:hybrid sensor histidine kinase/response regulator [Paraburkholderia ginsengisoli]|uniref:histidine kinase n=1 Tax=Paraburkholderia ginsengisoli TaxID=311231 RepID=A0A7T4TCT5_9BURK|nr:hybrid sensor histidine kinase/response regulator [Paraburkholderia ginsengisoli]QQC67908.1 response regulator [Paraburkholderia ginsengisoli]
MLLLGLVIFFGAISSTKAQLRSPVVLDNSRVTIDPWDNVTVLSDPYHSFTLSDVLAKQNQFKIPSSPHANLGLRKDTVWLRTDIALSTDAPVDWWLGVDIVLLDEIDLYVVEQERITQHLSVPVRPVLARRSPAFPRPVFQLALQPGRHYELLIRVRKVAPYAMLMPMSLDRIERIIKHESSIQFWRSVALGMSTGFVIYALFIATLKRDPLCLWFALFAASSSLYASIYYGLANEWLSPISSIAHGDFIVRFCLLFRAISCFLFVDGVLDLRERNPRISGLLKSFAAFFALLTALFAIDLVTGSVVTVADSIAGASPLFLLTPFVMRRARDHDSLWNWAIVGAAFYLMGMTVSTALHSGYLPWNWWTDSAEHVGAFLNEVAWVVVVSIRTHRRQQTAELTAKHERQKADHERRIAELLAVDLARQKEVVEETSLEKSRFLAAASHDLRQPIHAISLFVGALRRTPMHPDSERLVRHIEASTEAVDRLFAALLDISKLDAGVVEVHSRPFSIDAVLTRTCRDYADEASAKGLTLSHVPCRAIVDSDPTLVERIVRNFVSNAVRYTDAGKILVGCRLGGTHIAVQVWDTGRGIPTDLHDLVFQEYYQVGNPERDREKGLGLGLAIVRRLANLLACNLQLRSEPGRGSCFEILLARAKSAAMPLEAPVGDMPGTFGTGLIVVIDDEQAIRTGMSTLLTQWGYEVLEAASADEAIQLLGDYAERPAMLICDLRLRDGESGIDAIEKLREEYNESIPAMLITGDTAARGLLAARTSEVLVLHKPVPSGQLRAAISGLLGIQLDPQLTSGGFKGEAQQGG